MAQDHAPTQPKPNVPLVESDGRLTAAGLDLLDQVWRQIAAGFAVVPCQATGTNLIALRPTLHREGARTYADHMVFGAVAAATSTGDVTAYVTDGTKALTTIKVFKNDGAAQAGAGDVVENSFYLFCYVAALDSGAGGLVLK